MGQCTSKVLVVVGSTGMGDAVEGLPLFELIREHWPGIHVTAGYFKEKQRAILEVSPHVSDVVRLSGSVRYAWRAVRGMFRNFNTMRSYDTIVFLYKKDGITWPMVLAAKLAGARVLYKHGYRYPDRRRNTYSDFPEHVFFQIVTSNLLLGLPLTRVREPRISLLEEDKRFAEDFFDRKGLGQRPIVIINPQSGHRVSHPDWGIEKYAGVANALVEWGADVLTNGGAEEQLRELKRVVGVLRSGVILLEKPGPRELAAVIAKCDLYIGSASGPASVAMAVGTPTITLIGPGDHGYPGQGRIGPIWWPRDPRHKVISKVGWCQMTMQCNCHPEGWRPLKRFLKHLGLWKPWKKARKSLMRSFGACRRPRALHPCLEAISVEEVVELAKGHLRKYGSKVGASTALLA